jgi:1-phosphofructokinase
MAKVITVTLNPSIDVTLWVDGVDDDRVNRVQREIRQPGGKGINVSKVLGRAGLPTLAMGVAGVENMLSLTMPLEDEDIKHRFIRSIGSIRENLTLRYDNHTVKINRTGPGCGKEELLKLTRSLNQEIEPGDICMFGGSLPPGVTAGNLVSLANRARDCGAKIVLDSDSVNMEELLQMRPWLITPNIHEFGQLIGYHPSSERDMVDAARDLIRQGVEQVLLSMGAAGLIAINAEEAVQVTVPHVPVRSTVGAGESTLAGFLIACLQDRPLTECARMAAAFGTASVTEEATELAKPDSAEKYYNQVFLTRL